MKNQKRELQISLALSQYINIKYPNVLFFIDASGVRLTIGQATQLKKQRSKRFKIPDFIILQPCKGYHALILELKKEDESPYLKNGELSKSEHVQEQNKALQHLNKLGYKAQFAVGLDEAMKVVDEYLG